MATSNYVGIDVSKARLDVAEPGGGVWQVENTKEGIDKFVQQMQALQLELIVVEATGGYQGNVVDALFQAGLSVAVVNPARMRQFARACGLLPRRTNWMLLCWQSLDRKCSLSGMKAKVKPRSN